MGLTAVRGGAVGHAEANGGGGTSAQPPLLAFLSKNFFIVGMAAAIAAAAANPSLGLAGGPLRPEVTIDALGVSTIFLLSGLGLPLNELTSAAMNVKLNAFIQLLNLAAYPALVKLGCVALAKWKAASAFLHPRLLDGVVAMSCLPTTVNMCVVLTQSAGGNVASALFNAVLGNLLGIFVTPLLIFKFLGSSISVPYLAVLKKLTVKVIVPVALGQLLRVTPLKAFRAKHKGAFGRASECLLLMIIYTTFCEAIHNGMGVAFSQISGLFVLLPLLQVAALGSILGLARWPGLGLNREQQIAAMFCAAHKTIAFGMPLLKTIFDGNPNLALLCAPLLIYHPLQLVVGSFLVPSLKRYAGEDSSGLAN